MGNTLSLRLYEDPVHTGAQSISFWQKDNRVAKHEH